MSCNSVSNVLEQNLGFSTLQLKKGDDGKVTGFELEELLRKALWKEGNGSNDGSEIVSITEAGKHEHKGKRPAKEFLERRDSRTV